MPGMAAFIREWASLLILAPPSSSLKSLARLDPQPGSGLFIGILAPLAPPARAGLLHGVPALRCAPDGARSRVLE
ncbi:MAG: hypothetical protein DI539_30090 [Flavobacterium psychrophilum]|nr:MAG: hypothetical protein DI539_30090 [Flavobacterium psychrophilum]